ncbi:MAG: DUF2891 domain-containing protein [Planctomycetes bacterium]|nr:DUF2891 domain-containing protein [Planctomycetota bacterium]
MTPSSSPELPDPTSLVRYAEMALACVHREYPYALIHLLQAAEDLALPRDATPAFSGSFDWHSSVHTHWTLVRVARLLSDHPIAARALAAVDRSLTPENLEAERRFLLPRPGFERPYGLAWLTLLWAETRQLAEADPSRAGRWAIGLEPLGVLATDRLLEWFEKLSHPVRSGEHSQTAFAMGLLLDAAPHLALRGRELRERVAIHARDFFEGDRAAPMGYEPSGHDFLSPTLAEADVLGRVMSTAEFSDWLRRFLPGLDQGSVGVEPVDVPDRTDGKLAHLDGLNLSRAWMLARIARALDAADPRRGVLERSAAQHRDVALDAVDGRHYEGGHWLGSFAVYLLTDRVPSGS